ncbi:MAG: cofactor-independent phosphoglycerate mutase [Clostridia bacterium]
MKTVVILGDGMADYKIAELGGKSILDVAKKPYMDMIAKLGEVGLSRTVPPSMKPGSDNANLSVMGYDSMKCYTGRSPLEAVSIGVKLDDDDVTFRCNLVNLSDDARYEDKTMIDYSSDEITTEESRQLIEALKPLINGDGRELFAGISYRHCLKIKGFKGDMDLTPPHDISEKKITNYLPKTAQGEFFIDLYKKSYEILSKHPVNLARVKRGLRPANSMWLWGMGTKPALENFYEKNHVKGAVISAVDLIKGIGILAGMEVIEVEGATGKVHTNFDGKAQAAIDAFKRGLDFVYIHMEAPDEAGHRGELDNKIKSVELIDEKVVAPVWNYFKSLNEPYRILIMPDHPTPIALRTHVKDPVPYALLKSEKPSNCGLNYNEDNGAKSRIFYENGFELLSYVLK